jgi:hypothetical protein
VEIRPDRGAGIRGGGDTARGCGGDALLRGYLKQD